MILEHRTFLFDPLIHLAQLRYQLTLLLLLLLSLFLPSWVSNNRKFLRSLQKRCNLVNILQCSRFSLQWLWLGNILLGMILRVRHSKQENLLLTFITILKLWSLNLSIFRLLLGLSSRSRFYTILTLNVHKICGWYWCAALVNLNLLIYQLFGVSVARSAIYSDLSMF